MGTEILSVILLSILLAVTMKTADNLNEHGLKLFKGANILFGILWGIFGALLILKNNFLANLWLAVFIGLTVRGKQDMLNHGLGFGIIFSAFLMIFNKFLFLPKIYWFFFIAMMISGLTHDYLSSRKDIKKIYSELFHSLFFYTAVPFVFAIFTKIWIGFYSLFSFVITYEIIRYIQVKSS